MSVLTDALGGDRWAEIIIAHHHETSEAWKRYMQSVEFLRGQQWIDGTQPVYPSCIRLPEGI